MVVREEEKEQRGMDIDYSKAYNMVYHSYIEYL
jgi:hypothetical protein